MTLSYRQRLHWISIAREALGTSVPVWVIWFDTPYNVSVVPSTSRVLNNSSADRFPYRCVLTGFKPVSFSIYTSLRKQTLTCGVFCRPEPGLNHPTIKDAETGLQVLRRFSSQFYPPAPHEGHERLLRLTPADHPSAVYTHEDIVAILERVRDSPPIDISAALTQAPITQFFPGSRGRGRGHTGGRGYHNGRRGRGFSPGFQRGRGQHGNTHRGGSSSWRSDSHSSSSAEQRSFGQGIGGSFIATPQGYAPANNTVFRAGSSDARGRNQSWNFRQDRGCNSGYAGMVGGDMSAPSDPESSGWTGDGSANDPLTME